MNHQTAHSPSTQLEQGFARLPAVLRRTGLGRSTIYRLMAKREFPKACQLSKRAVGWRFTDLDRWEETRKVSGDEFLKFGQANSAVEKMTVRRIHLKD